ncbi:MAG: TetR/AcrR family transcriptional regulator [Nocardiaceae bacterium]|nr:TetR/AcrR family transcriptional regulator [Nocardiaceae bacterium]
MTNEEVSAFRQRLLDGLAASIEERGYTATKIDDIVRFAKTSKRTFYAEFASKRDCYLEVVAASHEAMRQSIETAIDHSAPWRDQVRQGVTGWLESVRPHPKLTLSSIRDLPTIDEHGLEVQRQATQAMTEVILRVVDIGILREAGIEPPSRPAAIILVGGLRELVATAIEDGTDVMTLAEDIVDIVIGLLETARVKS